MKAQAKKAREDAIELQRRTNAATAISRKFRNLKDRRERTAFEQKQLQAAIVSTYWRTEPTALFTIVLPSVLFRVE
jgi:hypothetical protein